MNKRIISAILAVITIMSLFVFPITVGASDVNFMKDKFTSKEEKLATMSYIMTSDDPDNDGKGDGVLELYVDSASGEMAIRNKLTGEIILSNPYNINDVFSQTNTTDKGIHLSQVYINYFKKSAGVSTISSMYSYNDCFVYDQATVEKTENGIRVYYILGEVRGNYAVPLKMSYYKLREKLLENGVYNEEPKSSKNKYNVDEFIKKNFRIYDPYDDTKTQSYKDQMIEKFPECVETPFVYLNSSTYASTDAMENLERELKKANPDYFVVSNEGEEKTELEKDMELLWSEADREKERGNFELKEYPNFSFAVEYNLTNDGLDVILDTRSISYDRKEYCLASISILPYFDAASMIAENYDNGYLFVPDGSGAISRFEDLAAVGSIGSLSLSLYGSDYAYYQITSKNAEAATMPVFGLVNETNKLNDTENYVKTPATGFFGIIEEGDALGAITAKIERNYVSIFPTFKYAEYDTYDIQDLFTQSATATKQITVVSNNFYQGDYRVKYTLLADDEVAKANGFYGASYIEMAKLYREYLGETSVNSNGEKIFNKITNPNENTTLFLEAFGSIKTKGTFLTFPVTVSKELTTFEDILNIQGELSKDKTNDKGEVTNKGITNISFILNGFYNGGLSSTYPTKIKWERVLGGKKGVNKLLEEDAANDQFNVVLDVNFSYSQGSKLFGGYSDKKYAVKTLDDRYTTKRAYYAATQTFERTSGVAVSAASFDTLYQKFLKSMSKYDFSSLATRALGSDLNSDFDKDDYYTREDAKNQTVLFLEKLTHGDRRFDIVLNTGNAYAMPYASSVLNAPLDSSKYTKTSQAIPFYGMVYHGTVEFAGGALNMEGDEDFMFLKALENGAALYYTIAMSNLEALKFDSEYSKYYSVQYDLLKDSIMETYNEYNELMKDKQDKYIVDHKFVNNGTSAAWYTDNEASVWNVRYQSSGSKLNNSLVVYVEYENGDGFFLNYNNEVVFIDAEVQNENGTTSILTIKIPAMGYHVHTAK
ncbi:MAG: hypothetical protein J6A96_02320 [Clostridia bacterium]|nr:hypothetical protein [Clostridia bacterium]